MKDRILDFVHHRRHVTFAELEQHLGEAMQGDLTMTHTEHPSIILWHGVSEGFVEALKALLDHDLVLKPTTVLTYICDGRTLTLPVAKRLHGYKQPHWLPCTLDLAARNGSGRHTG